MREERENERERERERDRDRERDRERERESDLTGRLNSFTAILESQPGANCLFALPNINLCYWLFISNLREKERARERGSEGSFLKGQFMQNWNLSPYFHSLVQPRLNFRLLRWKSGSARCSHSYDSSYSY